MMSKQFRDGDQELDKSRFDSRKQLDTIKNEDFKKTVFYQQALKRLRGDKELINRWLELQDSINCFIDASKSSKQADKDFKGVRQILQKKEGLFRMKMMGKEKEGKEDER